MNSPDAMLAELTTSPRPNGAIAKMRYSHDGMVDLIVQNPGISQNSLAAAFGYTPAWVSRIIASDAFQERLEARRQEIVDPFIAATIKERFQALVVQSLERLMLELEKPQIKPEVALRAAELGAKALGMGVSAAPPPASASSLDQLADRLIALKRSVYNSERIVDGQVIEGTALPVRGENAKGPDQGR